MERGGNGDRETFPPSPIHIFLSISSFISYFFSFPLNIQYFLWVSRKSYTYALWRNNSKTKQPVRKPYNLCTPPPPLFAQKTPDIGPKNRLRIWGGLVNCPTRWSLLFIFGFLYWSSSWRWQPHIGVCRLLWPLLRAGMVLLAQFFCKMYFVYASRSRKKNLTTFFLVWPPKTAAFFRRGSLAGRISRIVVLPDYYQIGRISRIVVLYLQTPIGGHHPVPYFSIQITEK